MSDHRHSRAWQRRRAAAIAAARESPEPVLCWRCEQPLDVTREPVDLGHVHDLALMVEGDALITRLEHVACSRSAGARLQAELRTTSANRAWQSRPLRRGGSQSELKG